MACLIGQRIQPSTLESGAARISSARATRLEYEHTHTHCTDAGRAARRRTHHLPIHDECTPGLIRIEPIENHLHYVLLVRGLALVDVDRRRPRAYRVLGLRVPAGRRPGRAQADGRARGGRLGREGWGIDRGGSCGVWSGLARPRPPRGSSTADRRDTRHPEAVLAGLRSCF